MIGRLDRDEVEEKKCYDPNYGHKLPSYRKGYEAGLRDAQNDDEKPSEKNPYILSPEVWILLKKRARWEMGYREGKRVVRDKKRKKVRR